MKNFFKGKVATGLVVLSTIILAGVAIFTAFRLYQLRQESVSPASPESQPLAWDCSKYTFSVSQDGSVSAKNRSTRNEPAQQAKVYINNSLADTLNVPALTPDQSASIGSVQVPSGGFTWRVEGTLDCQNSGTIAPSCKLLTFTLTENTPTEGPTKVPSVSVTVTESPTGTVTATVTPTDVPQASPTPTLPPPPLLGGAPECVEPKPSSPTITSIQKSGNQATVTWTAVSTASHYVISYGTSPTNLIYGVPNTGNVTTYTIGSLNSNSTYYFTVYAVNKCMPSDGSALVSSVAGSSTATGELPASGISLPTLISLIAGFALLLLAIVLAI